MTTTLLEQLVERLQGTPDRDGRWHATCPFCNAVGMIRNRPQYHFYLYHLRNGANGATCWSCGYKGSLRALAAHLGELGDENVALVPERAEQRELVAPWSKPNAWDNWRRFMSTRLDAIQAAWQSYRPYTRETVERYGLAVERLLFYREERGWFNGRYQRLIIPIMDDQRMLGMRGRAYQPMDDGPKWMSATGTQSWLCGLEDVQPDSEVIWCESLADRILAMQESDGPVAVATGGLTWRDEWLDQLASKRPRHVLVWFDNDLSGNGNQHHARAWLEDWRQEMSERNDNKVKVAAPKPRGPILVQELRRRNVRAGLYQWSANDAHRRDMGDVLMSTMSRKITS